MSSGTLLDTFPPSTTPIRVPEPKIPPPCPLRAAFHRTDDLPFIVIVPLLTMPPPLASVDVLCLTDEAPYIVSWPSLTIPPPRVSLNVVFARTEDRFLIVRVPAL